MARFECLLSVLVHHLLLLCWIGSANAQAFSSFYSYQANSGIRETLLAINAYCDNTCSPFAQTNQINMCFQNSIMQNEIVIQILRACTTNTRYIIYCTQNALVQLENCALQYAANYPLVASQFTKTCFRDSLAVGTIDCLRMRYPRLNRLLPLAPLNYGRSSSSSFLNTALLGLG